MRQAPPSSTLPGPVDGEVRLVREDFQQTLLHLIGALATKGKVDGDHAEPGAGDVVEGRKQCVQGVPRVRLAGRGVIPTLCDPTAPRRRR